MNRLPVNYLREFQPLGIVGPTRQPATPLPVALVTVKAISDRSALDGRQVEIGQRYELPLDVARTLVATGKAALVA